MIEVKKLLEMQFPQFKETDNNQKVSIADILEKIEWIR
jgi:archaellum component FlaC